jgi:2-oxoglutarate ferredoxin oxidoreductase subunit beta
MTVLAVAGDGDCYGEGGNHLVHAMRRNINVTLFVHNNQIYGLTKGQASPTTMAGAVTKTQPFGNLSMPLNPLAMAVALDCSFVGRGFAGDGDYLKDLMMAAVEHNGFALLDILQPCVTFNKHNTYPWYQERVYQIEEAYDPRDRTQAFEKSLEWGDRIPTGIIYRNERSTLEDGVPVLQTLPLVKQAFSPETLASEMDRFY